MRDLVHLIVFSYNTQSSKKDWKERHRVTTTFYMVHVVHFYFLFLVSSDLFLLFDSFFLSGNLLGLGGLVQGGVGRVEWRVA